MSQITWNGEPFKKSLIKNGMDGLEEFASTVWLPQAKKDCPVGVYPKGSGKSGGTMRNSLGYERDDADMCVWVGGGGAAKDYIFKQEMDRSLTHTTGKAGFIKDSVNSHIKEIPSYIAKHIK